MVGHIPVRDKNEFDTHQHLKAKDELYTINELTN